MKNKNKHKGACGELIAAIWLMKQGYDVFRNVSAHGLIDLVAIKGDEVKKFDVKSIASLEYKYNLKKPQIEKGILPILVDPAGNCKMGENTSRDPVTCAECGKPFVPRRSGALRCGKRCAEAYENKRNRNSKAQRHTSLAERGIRIQLS